MSDQQNLRKLARELAAQINEETLRLGNVLVAISEAGLYHHWGYSRWPDYLKEEVGIALITCNRVMTLSKWARVMRCTVKQRERLGRLGTSKAYIVTKLCTSKDKIDHWLDIAEQNTLKHMRAELAGVSTSEVSAAWFVWIDGSQERSIKEAMDLAYEVSEYELTKGGLLTAVCEDYIRRHKKSRRGKAAM